MTVTINGTSGITTPSVNSTGSNVLGDNVADTLNVGNGAIVTDSSGNVGIGTSSPDNYTGRSCLSINGSSGGIFTLQLAGTQQFRGYVNSGSTTLQAMTGTLDVRTTDASALTLSTNSAERMRIDSSGNLLFNSGYGSVATAYGCRAWVNFNGTGTVAIRASGNVSSITDNGTGDYTVNFTNAMPDTNYSVSCSTQGHGTSTNGNYLLQLYGTTGMATGSVRVLNAAYNGATSDAIIDTVSVFR